jgi:hypothetical protein
MKAYGGVDVYIHIFLTSALVGGEWSAPRPGCFTPRERALGTHWIGGWVDPRAGMDDVEKRKFLTLPGLELRPLRRPARSQSLYRLRYPGSHMYIQYVRDLCTCECIYEYTCLFHPAIKVIVCTSVTGQSSQHIAAVVILI